MVDLDDERAQVLRPRRRAGSTSTLGVVDTVTALCPRRLATQASCSVPLHGHVRRWIDLYQSQS